MTSTATVPAKNSKSSRSNCWWMRVTGPEEFLRQKCEDMSKWLDVSGMLATYHVGSSKENPHCHACIETTVILQKQSFAVRIKTHFGIEKPSQYELVLWDGVRDAGAASYLFHEGEDRVICRKGWTDAQLEAAILAQRSFAKVVSVNKERAQQKLVTKALDHFQGQHATRLQILEFMVRETATGSSYYPGEYKLKQYVEEVHIKLADKYELDAIVHAMFYRMWRD